ITAGSDFDRSSLTGLGLSGTGDTLFLKLGDPSNQLTLKGVWQLRGGLSTEAGSYFAFESEGSVLLFQGAANRVKLANGSASFTGVGTDDTVTLTAPTLNDLAGVVADGGAGSDVLTFDGSNAYTTEQLRLSGGEGADTILAATRDGQYAGALRVEGGGGDDLIEVGHVEGSRSADSGLFGGDGSDRIVVRATLADVGVFGNGAFGIDGGVGDDIIELAGRQFNLRGDAINTVDGGSGFDTLVWNARYDLNRSTNQTGVDATNPAYAQEIGVRSIEMLDVAASGVVGRTIALSASDVREITAGSDFDRSSLTGLGLSGTGDTLFLKLGDPSNQLTLKGVWQYLGSIETFDESYLAYIQDGEVLLVEGGSLAWNASGSDSSTPLAMTDITETADQSGSDALLFENDSETTLLSLSSQPPDLYVSDSLRLADM
ncbi:hypothetical protein GPA25_15025, partial [Aromatoleum diolicum]|nr:hypothetical protein [Aromatoleum diolicum]